MKFFAILLILSVVTFGKSSPVPKDVALLQENFVRDDHGQYAYSFLTGDNVARTEQGSLVPNKEGTANVLVTRVRFSLINNKKIPRSYDFSLQGSYSYINPDGETVLVNYTADENGFQVSGDHLPTPPTPPTA